ncbi:glycine cleavage T C-terminal barrel domain-containing protein [Thorsellia kenyensis]|uniref:Glycine cleavage T C-terminal barrel domain-containing protein n=1 Tax=Thorsellia kenyensis TaxID=1549888 RepID=A0ABV6CG91_9GAMM
MNMLSIHKNNNATIGLRNGVETAISYGNLDESYRAVRKNILLSDYSHFGIAQVKGDSAWELCNLLVSGDVSSIRDEQALYTLILDEEGKIDCDLYVAYDDERFLLISEWKTGEELANMAQDLHAKHAEDIEDIDEISSLTPEWGMLHFEGPYAWELLSLVYGMDVIGLPFQEHMHVSDELILLRSGKHGEFSYKLLGPQAELVEVWESMIEQGADYDMVVGGLDVQSVIRVENPCWQPEVFNPFSRCPIELQMQWAVRYDKETFQGFDALIEKTEAPVVKRAIGIMFGEEVKQKVASHTPIYHNESKIGEVIISEFSPDLEKVIGRAMFDNDFAWAEIDDYTVMIDGKHIGLQTSAIPFARNFSFLVNPSEHSYVDKTRPSNLIEQLEWQKQKEQQEQG